MTTHLSLDAPAKLNLGLAITGRRPDGYHDLVSVFHAISWADTLTFSPAREGIRLSCSRADIPFGPENLVWRAADLVRRRFSIPDGVAIRLEKRIPVGAGLGGGSSDAATTIRGLAALWRIRADPERWLELCAEIGSDVPFFWYGGTALVEGRGERVHPLPARETLPFVVVVPPVAVSTAWAYRQLAPPFPDAAGYRAHIEELRAGSLSLRKFCAALENTFAPVVERHHPQVRQAREWLLAQGAASALMSGSGSAVFGVFPDLGAATQAGRHPPAGFLAHVATSWKAREG